MKKGISKTVPQEHATGKSYPGDAPTLSKEARQSSPKYETGEGTNISTSVKPTKQSSPGGIISNGQWNGKGADIRTEAGSLDKGMSGSAQTPQGGSGTGAGGESVKGLSRVKSLVSSALKTTAGKVALAGTGIIAAAAVTLGIISAATTPDLSGTWIFHTTETGECGHTYDGWTIPVWQRGKTFTGNNRPQPVITDGRISGSQVTFSIIVYPEDDYGDGNFTDLVGTLEGNTITGTLSGHNGGKSCFWEGNFTVTIEE